MHLSARGDLRPRFSRAPNTKGPIESYLLTYRVLGVPVLVFRGDRAKAAELLVLLHENAVLRRHISRVRYDSADRLWFAALAAPPPEALDRDLPRDVDDAAGLAPQTGRG